MAAPPCTLQWHRSSRRRFGTLRATKGGSLARLGACVSSEGQCSANQPPCITRLQCQAHYEVCVFIIKHSVLLTRSSICSRPAAASIPFAGYGSLSAAQNQRRGKGPPGIVPINDCTAMFGLRAAPAVLLALVVCANASDAQRAHPVRVAAPPRLFAANGTFWQSGSPPVQFIPRGADYIRLNGSQGTNPPLYVAQDTPRPHG